MGERNNALEASLSTFENSYTQYHSMDKVIIALLFTYAKGLVIRKGSAQNLFRLKLYF